MKTHTIALVVLVALFHSPQLTAYDMREEPLADRIARADLIVVGITACTTNGRARSSSNEKYATIHAQQVLKGAVDGDFEVLVLDPIVEDQPNCCEPGVTYLMFLKRVEINRYVAVNGRFGIYRIEQAVSTT